MRARRPLPSRPLLALAPLLALLACLLPAPAGAAEPSAVRVVLDALLPAVPSPGQELQVGGRLVNDGLEPLRDLAVRLRSSRSPLGTRGQVAQVAGGDEQVRAGQGRDTTRVAVPGTLAPGAAVAFTLRVPVDDLGLEAFGVYVVGVEALDGGGRVGLTRTFLPYAARDTRFTPARVAWLVPLVDRPHRDTAGVFDDDSLAASLRPGGRLGRLVAEAARSATPVGWVVDPMLLEDAQRMADPDDPYLVRAGDATVRGRGAAAARAWLAQVVAATRGKEVLALPYADPDIAALARAGQPRALRDAVTAGTRVTPGALGRAVDTGLAWPAEGVLEESAVGVLAQAGLGGQGVVLRESAAAPVQAPPYTPTGRVDLRAGEEPPGGRALPGLLYDERLSALAAAGVDEPGQRVLATQRFLAETAMITAERPGGSPRTVLVAPPRRWDPAPGRAGELLGLTRGAPWLEPASVAALRAEPAGEPARAPLRYPEDAAAAELPPAHLEGVAQLSRQTANFNAILTEADPVAQGTARRALALRSTALRGPEADERRRAALSAARTALAAQRDKVHLSAVPSITLGARSGPIPLTVVNDLDQRVTVRLALTPRTRQISVATIGEVTVGPRRRSQVQVPAEALANGLVTVEARLNTPRGAPYGRPVQLRVQVTQVGTFALWLTVGAAALLFGGAALRLARRARSRLPARPG